MSCLEVQVNLSATYLYENIYLRFVSENVTYTTRPMAWPFRVYKNIIRQPVWQWKCWHFIHKPVYRKDGRFLIFARMHILCTYTLMFEAGTIFPQERASREQTENENTARRKSLTGVQPSVWVGNPSPCCLTTTGTPWWCWRKNKWEDLREL